MVQSKPPAHPADTRADVPAWAILSSGAARPRDAPIAGSRIFGRVLLAAVAVIVAVALLSVLAARQLAEVESVADASEVADVLADALVQPEITDALVAGDPAALASLDAVVRGHVLDDSVVRVKLWDASGRIVYSDEPRLIGSTFELEEEELEVLSDPRTDAEVSDVSAPENRFEKNYGKLLEVYRPVWAPDGSPLLFEAYFRYDEVTERSGRIWQGLAAVTVGSIVLLLLLLLPVLRRLLTLLARLQNQRESLLRAAVDASAAERRRIAGTLHDGVVQDLVAASYTLSAVEDRALADGAGRTAADVSIAGGAVRSSIGGLRSLLVEIYPPSLAAAGLRAALGDLAQSIRSRGIAVDLELDDLPVLDDAQERVVFRVAQECLANAVKHSAASRVMVRVALVDGRPQLDIRDDGRGFDVAARTGSPAEGHFGLRVLADVAEEAGAVLGVRSAPGAGTWWRLRLGAS